VIRGIRPISAALARLDLRSKEQDLLSQEADALEHEVHRFLSLPGSDLHGSAGREVTALVSSLGHLQQGSHAVIGSTAAAAVARELGTRTDPPRGFLAPVASSRGAEIAESIGAEIAGLLKEALR
jgi:hypothetical protein